MKDTWHRLGSVFDQVFDLPATERRACLEEICRGEGTLRAEVDELLRAHDLAEHFTRAGQELAVEALGTGFAEDVGSRVFGPYTVIKRLGRGGMGEVFLAARADDEFDQVVAIKTLRSGGIEGYERFRVERQVHADLEHAGIARLYGGGTNERGVPYIVMEYVEGGRPINEHCDRHELSVEARIDLFSTVCEAVAYAHRNLIVHRDIKPSNILVTPGGLPKLLDFGISKRLDPGVADFDPTAPGTGPLTPAYASPEQLLGEPVTTASDVYSLGALLALLLTGQPPFARSLNERLQQLHADHLPAVERTALAQTVEPAAQAFLALDRSRRLDLEAIVAKACHRELRQRYGSVEQLAADLRCWRESRPVQARLPTLGYRFSRWSRRNWLVASLAGVIAVTMIMAAFGLLAQNRQVLSERDRAQVEAQKSERMLALLLDLLEGSDPAKAQGVEISVNDVLMAAEPRIDRELADQPTLRAALLEALGKVFLSLGNFDTAERILNRARALWQETSWPASATGAATLDHLAKVANHRGDFAQALELLEQARDLRVAEFGHGSIAEALSLGQIANSQLMLQRFDEARATAQNALEIFDRQGAVGAFEVKVDSRFILGEVIYRREGRDASLPIFEQALAESKVSLGEFHPLTLALLTKLADISADHPADYARALGYIDQEIAALERLHRGQDHPDLATSLDVHGGILARRGSLDEAEHAFERSLAMSRRLLGEKSPALAVTLANFGWFQLFRRHDPARAEPILREALAMAEEYFPVDAPLLSYPLTAIGRCRVLSGDPRSGEKFLRRAWAIRIAANGAEALESRRVALFLGESLAAQGRCTEAGELLEQAVPALTANGEPDDLERMKEPQRVFEGNCLQANRHLDPAIRNRPRSDAGREE